MNKSAGLTIEDANRRLPLVRVIVRDAVELRTDLNSRLERLNDLREEFPRDRSDDSVYSEEVVRMEESIENDEIRIDEFCSELKQIGASLVNAATGLVEFDSTLNGQPVCLSWKYGESEVSWWRFPEDSSEERRPLILTEQQVTQ